MKIIDKDGKELKSADRSKGRLVKEKRFVAHHEAREAVQEQWHYETVKEYPNGGKDVRKVIDVPGVEAAEAWDEYEDVMRYVPFTEEELAERKEKKEKSKKQFEERISRIEKCLELLMKANGISLDE